MPLISALRHIMWRNCKSTVHHQMGIPEQKEIVHSVVLSDLETFFYNTEHIQCTASFREKAKKLEDSLSMHKMNAQTLQWVIFEKKLVFYLYLFILISTQIMSPLQMLLRDCTMPTVIARSGNGKKLLSPDELHQRMNNDYELACKTHLRSIASSLNGKNKHFCSFFFFFNSLSIFDFGRFGSFVYYDQWLRNGYWILSCRFTMGLRLFGYNQVRT